MIKLALIGKNIQHSRSKEVYEKILGKQISYNLIDCDEEKGLPELNFLRSSYDGISITAPYKRSYFKDVDFIDVEKGVDSINCIVFEENLTRGINTDYFACSEILDKLTQDFSSIAIIGDGATSVVIQNILEKMNLKSQVFSRKQENIGSINLKNPMLIINTCSRDYVFTGKLNKQSLFWDINYDNELTASKIKELKVNYLDGFNLLYLQAKHALKAWNIK